MFLFFIKMNKYPSRISTFTLLHRNDDILVTYFQESVLVSSRCFNTAQLLTFPPLLLVYLKTESATSATPVCCSWSAGKSYRMDRRRTGVMYVSGLFFSRNDSGFKRLAWKDIHRGFFSCLRWWTRELDLVSSWRNPRKWRTLMGRRKASWRSCTSSNAKVSLMSSVCFDSFTCEKAGKSVQRIVLVAANGRCVGSYGRYTAVPFLRTNKGLWKSLAFAR